MTKRLAIFAALVGLAAISFAQDRQPRGKAETMVGSSKVVIDYGRPALKGRSLDELMKDLPEDRIWRAGENQITTMETSGDIAIGGTAIPAGKYSLYIYAPASGNWALCVNKDPGIELGKIFAQAPPAMQNELWPRARRVRQEHQGRRSRSDRLGQEARRIQRRVHHRPRPQHAHLVLGRPDLENQRRITTLPTP